MAKRWNLSSVNGQLEAHCNEVRKLAFSKLKIQASQLVFETVASKLSNRANWKLVRNSGLETFLVSKKLSEPKRVIRDWFFNLENFQKTEDKVRTDCRCLWEMSNYHNQLSKMKKNGSNFKAKRIIKMFENSKQASAVWSGKVRQAADTQLWSVAGGLPNKSPIKNER